MYFIQPSAYEVDAALQSWQWLPLDDKTPYAVTAIGDVFFRSAEGLWFLDRIEGNLDFVANDEDELQSILNTEDGQEHYLWISLVDLLRENGLQLNTGECYDFITAPILGGEVSLDNVEPRGFEMVLSIAGQVHDQIKDMPVGSQVSQTVIEG